MIYLFLLISGTVPLEYPYFEIVKREVSYIPLPQDIDTMTYERELELTYKEDSALVIVEGLLLERWVGEGDIQDLQDALCCDSVKRRSDTLMAYSRISFLFTASYAKVVSSEVIAGMRGAGEDQNYNVKDVLSRFGMRRTKYSILADAGSMVTIRFKRRPGMVFMNLTTGAVVGMEMREPVDSSD